MCLCRRAILTEPRLFRGPAGPSVWGLAVGLGLPSGKAEIAEAVAAALVCFGRDAHWTPEMRTHLESCCQGSRPS